MKKLILIGFALAAALTLATAASAQEATPEPPGPSVRRPRLVP